MLRITVDRQACEGYANCVIAAPDALELDSEGIAVATREEFPLQLRSELEEAVRSCPTGALRLDGTPA